MKPAPSRVTGPYTFENLSLFLIHCTDLLPRGSYDVLQRAMERKQAVVHETGTVGELLIENLGDIDLFIQSGEIVKGGRQDRVLGVDLIVGKKSGRVPIPSFCVEQSRWHQRGHESAVAFSASPSYLASKAVKASAKLDPSQGKVWDSVAEEQVKLSAAVHASVTAAASPSSYINERLEFVNGIWRDYSKCTEAVDALVGHSVGLDATDWSAIEFDIEVSSDGEDEEQTTADEADFSNFAVGDEFSRTSEAIAQDLMQQLVLLCLGHRWPKQLEPGEPFRGLDDQDGVIPITSGGDTPLIELVRDRLAVEHPGGTVTAVEREFEGIIDVPLEQWLAGPFFERHISQFKKRPIAWQLETVASRQPAIAGGKGNKKREMAGKSVFACLIYYHKLDVDVLSKIRTQYVGLLLTGFETEFRTLERLANPTGDQQTRRVQLEQWIDELQAFNQLLEDVSMRGFGPDAFRPARSRHQ